MVYRGLGFILFRVYFPFRHLEASGNEFLARA